MICVRALTLFWILAAVTGLLLACAGGKEQPITEGQVEALIKKVDRAIEYQDIDGVLAHISENAQFTVTVEGIDDTIVLTKSQYASALKQSWAAVDRYEYVRKDTEIIVSLGGESATVIDEILESGFILGQAIHTESTEVTTLSMEGGKLVVTSLEAIVRTPRSALAPTPATTAPPPVTAAPARAAATPAATVVPDSAAVPSTLSRLSYRVVDAEYSQPLDKIVMVSSSPNELHIYDPVTEQDVVTDLPLAPSAVSVRPDGLFAAVGHDGWISYVNLSTRAVEKTISVSTDVIDIILAGNGYAYAFPRRDQWETIRSVNIATEMETTTPTIRAGTLVKLHPDGQAIYGANNGLSPSDIEKYSIVEGTAQVLYDSPYHGDYAMCGDLWMSEDGLRIFTRCGNVFRSSPIQGQDMVYNGSLSQLEWIEFLTHSSSLGKVIAIPGTRGFGSMQTEDTQIQIYDYDFSVFEKSVQLPSFVIGVDSYAGHGRFVFVNRDGSKVFVVVQADEGSGILLDYGVAGFDTRVLVAN